MAACGWGVRAKVKHVVSKFLSAPSEFNPCEWNLSELLLVGISCTELVCRLYDRSTVCSHHRAIRILLTTIPPLGRAAEYCDQSACESVSPRAYLHNHSHKLHQIFSACCLLAMTWSFSGGVAIHYVLSVVWMTSYFPMMGPTARVTQEGCKLNDSPEAARIWHRGVYWNWFTRRQHQSESKVGRLS